MADDPELQYLLPTFDPSSLTIPRLRSILVEHEVYYPSSAKKQELIDIFNDNVKPKAKRLLAARQRIKPSARGIEDVPSSQESVGSTLEEEPVAPTPRSSRRPSKKTMRKEPDSVTPVEDEVPASVKSSRKSSSTRPKSVASEVTQSTTRSRTATRSPSVKLEEREPAHWDGAEGDSNFSSENPFQSGSSPSLAPVRSATENKRHTVGAVADTPKKTPSTRRKTDMPATSSTRKVSRKREPAAKKEVVEEVPAGEEFTPEEQLELQIQEASRDETAARPERRVARRERSSGVAKGAPWAIVLALLGGLATVWRQEKLEVGFCGVGSPSASIAGVEIPQWAEFVRPQCEPCPPHAYCHPQLKLTCDSDFIQQPHPLSLGGVVPLPPTCEPDGEKARKVKAVADRAVEELRTRNALWECGELKDENGRKEARVELEETKLKEEVSSKRKRGMTQEEFDDLWSSAIGEIADRDEVVSEVEGRSGQRRLRSTSLAHVSLGCAVRRSVRVTLVRYLWQLVAVIALAASALYARVSVSERRDMEAQAKRLASFALDRLATQAALNAQDPNRVPEAWVSMSQLRDDVLRNEFSTRKRQRLWERVQKKVEANSNVRPVVREGRNGEVSRVWEWIGSAGAIEGAPDGFWRPSSARVSFGPGASPGAEEAGEGLEQRYWNEGRPIY